MSGLRQHTGEVLAPVVRRAGRVRPGHVRLDVRGDQGNIYVLSHEDQGYDAGDFRLDVYTPGGLHLFRQRGMAVAAMTVDLWRNLYSLNSGLFLGPGGRTEPAVSEWIPSTPKTQA